MTYAPEKFEVATSNGLGGYAFTRKKVFDFQGQGHTNVAQYPAKYHLHNVTYTPAYFEVATFQHFRRCNENTLFDL